MKVTVTEDLGIQLEEVFSGLTLKTKSGETLSIYMRDSGFEFNYQGKWYFAKEGYVEPFVKSFIGEINFKDIKVKVYNDINAKDDISICVWRMRNPDSNYNGMMYMNNETGKMSFPNGVVIPEQTDKDREMLPQFIMTGRNKIDDELISLIDSYLDIEYKHRNSK